MFIWEPFAGVGSSPILPDAGSAAGRGFSAQAHPFAARAATASIA
jgi:hypothetical protein